MKSRFSVAPRADLMLALLVVAVIAMMVVPLPTVLIC
jgi:type III secretory pathway component EscV